MILVHGQAHRHAADPRTSASMLGPRGLHLGQHPAAREGAGAGLPRVRAAASRCRSSTGPGTFMNDAAGRILDRARARPGGRRPRGRPRRRGRARRRGRRASTKAQQDAPRAGAHSSSTRSSPGSGARLALKYGLDSVPALNNPRLRAAARLRAADRRRGAQAAVRLRVPRQGHRADPGAPAAGTERAPSAATRSSMVRRAVRSDKFSLKYGRYSVSGVPLTEAAAGGRADGALVLAALVALLLLLVLTLALASRSAVVRPGGAGGCGGGDHARHGGRVRRRPDRNLGRVRGAGPRARHRAGAALHGLGRGPTRGGRAPRQRQSRRCSRSAWRPLPAPRRCFSHRRRRCVTWAGCSCSACCSSSR